MLGVEGLTVRYGPIEAVRGIGFEVKRGEVFALLGANGAGKSSTLAAIARASGADGRAVALLPAGRGEVFAQMFALRDHAVEALDQPAHISPQALIARYGSYSQLTWAGEGAHAQLDLLRREATSRGIDLQTDIDQNDAKGWTLAPLIPHLAETIAVLGFREWRAGNVIAPEDLRADYVRASDAELKNHA